MVPEHDPEGKRADYESTPLSRAEYISAIVHLYRGELYRANSWRIRLDSTTNWAVLTTAGILSFSFSEEPHSHWVLLIGLALITVFLAFEARRYRFADIWYTRVRKIEENFYGPILRRDPTSPERQWGDLLSAELFHPRFKIGRMRALRARLIHNYWALYVVLLLCWGVKVSSISNSTWEGLKEVLADGLLPWWVPFAYLGVFLASLLAIVCFTPKPVDDDDHWNFSP